MKRRWGLFCAYCVVMFWLLFGQRLGFWVPGDYWQQVYSNLNPIPLNTVGIYLWVLQNEREFSAIAHAFVNLVGNVVMFVPLGIFLPVLWRKQRKFWLFLITTFGVILTVELVQLFALLGKCDVDDVLLNMLGVLLGFGCYKFLTKFSKK